MGDQSLDEIKNLFNGRSLKFIASKYENIFVKREEQINACFDFFLQCLVNCLSVSPPPQHLTPLSGLGITYYSLGEPLHCYSTEVGLQICRFDRHSPVLNGQLRQTSQLSCLEFT